MSHGIAQLSYIDAIINCFTSLEPTGQTHARFTDHARTTVGTRFYRVPTVVRAFRAGTNLCRLPSFKLSLALLNKSLHTFTHVFGCEEQEEILAFHSQSFLQRGLEGGENRSLCQTSCNGCLGRNFFG
jgi:hypothetical protein